MKNTEIKYNTSTDYENLYQLLKAEIIVIGFIALEIDGDVSTEYSKLIEMTYSKEYENFDLGNTTLFECDFDKNKFIKFCEKQYVRFIPLSHKKVKYINDQVNGLTKNKTDICPVCFSNDVTDTSEYHVKN